MRYDIGLIKRYFVGSNVFWVLYIRVKKNEHI